MASISEYIITHVFLPPKLPQEDDSTSEQDSALIKECRAALRSFQACLPSQEHWRWAAHVMMLSKMLELRDPSGDVLSKKFEILLETMKTKGMPKIRLIFALILSLIRRARRSYPQPECGPHRPKIATTILI
jgi:hypothetical protein